MKLANISSLVIIRNNLRELLPQQNSCKAIGLRRHQVTVAIITIIRTVVEVEMSELLSTKLNMNSRLEMNMRTYHNNLFRKAILRMKIKATKTDTRPAEKDKILLQLMMEEFLKILT